MSRTIGGVLAALLLAGIPVLAISTTASAQGLPGTWDGTIRVAGQEIGFQATFSGAGEGLKGTMQIQGASLALTGIRIDGPSVHFELPAGLGLAVFDGTLKDDAVSGPFKQGPASGTFEMKRHKEEVTAPGPPPPYKEEEVKITNGAVTLAGTLTLPPSAGRHPAVILITGSGAQNRDEDIFGFKVFRVIADHLTRQGIAVLRCDDRGVGGSTGKVSESTSEDFAKDVEADIAFLKTRPDIDGAHIGLLGHSEGALVAPMVAARSRDVAFIVLLSGPSLSGEKILLLQGERLLKASGAGPEVLARQAANQQKLFDVARGKVTAEQATSDLMAEATAPAAALPESQRKAVEEAARAQIATQVKAVQSPWFRFFLDYDPAPALAQVRCPVLAFFGELDLQVPVDVNKPGMEQAFAKAGNRDATIKVLPRANHLYQEAKTGAPSEYTLLKKEFVPELLPTITTWLQQHGGVKGSD